METKQFHIGDVLSITTGRLVSSRHIDGVYDILGFMSGEDLFTHLPRITEECKSYLLRKFPQLGTPEMEFAVAELGEMLESQAGKADPKHLILGWLSKLTSGKYGISISEMLDVEKLPPDVHERIDPESELAEKVHPDRIISVRV